MNELSPEEKAFLDEAYAHLKTTRRTFTEREALSAARREGYDLRLSFDERFARAEPRRGSIPPHWRLAEQTLANTHLLNELKVGNWDGQKLDEKLLALDQEDQLHYTFYPHDPRLFLNKRGAWEANGERQITLPLGLKEELDTFKDRLHARWLEFNAPLTVGQILMVLEELGWEHHALASIHRYLRAWLLTSEQFRRVGSDYWIPVEQLPPEIQRSRLQVLPIRTAEPDTLVDEAHFARLMSGEQGRSQLGEQMLFGGSATKTQVTWTTTLLSVHLIEGFLPIPKAVRGIYPPVTPGEEQTSVLKGLWHDDATELWIWLDRLHHRLYGPDLLDKIGFLSAGIKLRIEWHAEQIVLREVGHDQEVQQQETRLVDMEELKRLRGGIGEGYRQAIQALLLAAPEGLTCKEIVIAIRERHNHTASRGTIRATLASGGFIQHAQRWFAATSTTLGAKKLKEALLEALVEQVEECVPTPISQQEYVRTRARAIHHRLQEITSSLCEQRKE
jgi:hypothetical protein